MLAITSMTLCVYREPYHHVHELASSFLIISDEIVDDAFELLYCPPVFWLLLFRHLYTIDDLGLIEFRNKFTN